MQNFGSHGGSLVTLDLSESNVSGSPHTNNQVTRIFIPEHGDDKLQENNGFWVRFTQEPWSLSGSSFFRSKEELIARCLGFLLL